MPERLNRLAEPDLITELRHCCGGDHWARAFSARRPFDSSAHVLAAADAVFDAFTDEQWHDVLAATVQHGPGAGDEATCDATRVALRLYAERFGYPFVAVMSTAAADELLMRVRIRLGNDPATEWRVAQEEQRRLTRLRLQRLFAAAAEP